MTRTRLTVCALLLPKPAAANEKPKKPALSGVTLVVNGKEHTEGKDYSVVDGAAITFHERGTIADKAIKGLAGTSNAKKTRRSKNGSTPSKKKFVVKRDARKQARR